MTATATLKKCSASSVSQNTAERRPARRRFQRALHRDGRDLHHRSRAFRTPSRAPVPLRWRNCSTTWGRFELRPLRCRPLSRARPSPGTRLRPRISSSRSRRVGAKHRPSKRSARRPDAVALTGAPPRLYSVTGGSRRPPAMRHCLRLLSRRVDLDLSPEHELFRDTVRTFAVDRVAPVAEALDRESRFPYDLVAEMAALGLMGIPFPEDVGGAGGDTLAYAIAVEELARIDSSVAITLAAHTSLGNDADLPLRQRGSEGSGGCLRSPVGSASRRSASPNLTPARMPARPVRLRSRKTTPGSSTAPRPSSRMPAPRSRSASRSLR